MPYSPAKLMQIERPFLLDGVKVKRCYQCGDVHPFPSAFIGRRGVMISTCAECTEKKAVYAKQWRLDRLAYRARQTAAGRVSA